MLLLLHHLLLMQAHTHTTASRLSGVRVDVVVVTPLAVNAGTHTHHRLSSFRNQGGCCCCYTTCFQCRHTHTHATASRLSGVRVDAVVVVTPLAVNAGTHTTASRLSGVRVDAVVVVTPLAVNAGTHTHTPPPLVFPQSGVRSERNTLRPSRLTQESGYESDSQVSMMHTIPASLY